MILYGIPFVGVANLDIAEGGVIKHAWDFHLPRGKCAVHLRIRYKRCEESMDGWRRELPGVENCKRFS
jgi:hypothetical protein